jgi:hypothetical protein
MELTTASRIALSEGGRADSPYDRPLGCTLAAYARAKALPEPFLQSVGEAFEGANLHANTVAALPAAVHLCGADAQR